MPRLLSLPLVNHITRFALTFHLPPELIEIKAGVYGALHHRGLKREPFGVPLGGQVVPR